MFHRVYLRGRMQYYNHISIAFFNSVEKHGMPWFFANATYLNTLHRYHAHLAAETRRVSRLLRQFSTPADQSHWPWRRAGKCGASADRTHFK